MGTPRPVDPSQGASLRLVPGSTNPTTPAASPLTWEPARCSVPRLALAPPPALELAQARLDRDFPMDDLEGHGGVSPMHEPCPVDAPRAMTRAAIEPDAFVLEPATPLVVRVLDRIRGDRRVQMLLLATALLATLGLVWSQGPNPQSITNVMRHPERYDGRVVTLHGRVGEVYDVGAGHAYYLTHGHDAIVVFSQDEAPEHDQDVRVSGTLHAGSIGGESHLALFTSSRH